MAITRDDLTRFQAFALPIVERGDAHSIEQLADLWRLENPTAEQAAEDLASIRRSLADADAGRTVAASEALADARRAISES